MLSNKDIQRWLHEENFYHGKIDGIVGPQTRQAVHEALANYATKAWLQWSDDRQWIAVQQLVLKAHACYEAPVDGLIGPATRAALERYQNDTQGCECVDLEQRTRWPRQADLRQFFGKPGDHLKSFTTPYPLRLAWNTTQRVEEIRCHELVGPSLLRVMERVLGEYGSLSMLQQLGLDLYAGCYSHRSMKGNSKQLSLHAYGVAIDWCSEANQFRWGSDLALFARPEYEKWWRAWEDEGWISLGRERNFDWMHVQAARF